MDKQTSLSSRIAACILLLVNIITMVICLSVFGFSLWVISSPKSLSSVIISTQSPLLKALFIEGATSVNLAVGAAAVAMFGFSISLLGAYGTVSRAPFQLLMYSILVFLLMLLECSLIYYFSTNLIEKGVGQRQEWSHVSRVFFSCCEHNFTFTESNQRPWSCCGSDNNNCTAQDAYKQYCYSSVVNWLDSYQTSIYVFVVVFHLVLSSCSLVRRTGTSRLHT